MVETGTQAWLYGNLLDANITQDGHFITYPTADYLVDGNPGKKYILTRDCNAQQLGTK